MLSGNYESGLEPETSRATGNEYGMSRGHGVSEHLKCERKIQDGLSFLEDSLAARRRNGRGKAKKDRALYSKYVLVHIHSRQKGLCVHLN